MLKKEQEMKLKKMQENNEARKNKLRMKEQDLKELDKEAKR